MAENLPDIKSRLVIDDSQVAEVLGKVGKQAEAMGQNMHKGAALGKLGLWGLGEAAENAATSMGIPHKAGRMLGNTIEDLIGKTGKYAAVLGGMGLAVTGAAMIWSHFNEQKQKHREELEKSVGALSGEVSALYKNQGATEGVKQAQYDLLMIKREMLKFDLKRLIESETEAIETQGKTLKEGIGFFADLWFALKQFGGTEEEAERADADRRKKMVFSHQQTVALRKQHKAELAALDRTPDKFGAEADKPFNAAERVSKEIEAQAAYLTAKDQLWMAENRDYEVHLAAQMEIFNMHTRAKLALMTKGEEMAKYFALREKERAVYEMELERQKAEFKKRMQTQSLSNFTQTAQLMAQSGGKHAREWFSVQKTAAISEAVINTYQGATKALAQGGVWGSVLAASIIALGLAQVAKIRSQTFDGGAGASPAMPTYAANPATGLPTQGGGGTTYIIFQTPDGERRGEYELANGVLRTIYDNNGSVGGLSVRVERHA